MGETREGYCEHAFIGDYHKMELAFVEREGVSIHTCWRCGHIFVKTGEGNDYSIRELGWLEKALAREVFYSVERIKTLEERILNTK